VAAFGREAGGDAETFDPYAQRIKTLVWLNQVQQKQAEEDERLRQQDLAREEAYQLQKTNIQMRAATWIRRFNEQEARLRVKNEQKMWGMVTSLTNSKSRKLFEIGKTAAIAKAIIDGKAAIVGAYKFGASIGGPPLGAAFGAAAAAATMAQIQAMNAQSFGRGDGGGGAAGAGGGDVGVVQQAPQQPENQIVSINLEGEVFGREQVRGLIGQINDALDDGYTLRV
jgi:hypothetical protein